MNKKELTLHLLYLMNKPREYIKIGSILYKCQISKGYLKCYIPEKRKYKSAHRLIVENKIGRKLSIHEIVHHKDVNKLNNNINNLVIVSAEEHARIHHQLYTRKPKHTI